MNHPATNAAPGSSSHNLSRSPLCFVTRQVWQESNRNPHTSKTMFFECRAVAPAILGRTPCRGMAAETPSGSLHSAPEIP
jgi:hypothetical protein